MNRFGKILKDRSELKKYLDNGYKEKRFNGKIIVYKESDSSAKEIGRI